jgi:glycosyltransferase 2 family protein
LPDATPTFTETRSPARRNKFWVAAQYVIAAIVLWYIGKRLVEQWSKFRDQPLTVHPRWGMIALSAAITLVAYALLIETWRRIVVAWGDRLGFADAARIWFVSNLSIYIPAGPGWQIVQMGVLSSEQGIGALPAGAAAIINAAINIATGIAVAAVAGTSLLSSYLGDRAWLGWVLAIFAVGGICALPALLPVVFRIARDRLHRNIPLVTPAPRVILIAAAANVLAWIFYGVALEYLVVGILGPTSGNLWQFTATFATAYVVGYLAFIFPGGIGLREFFLAGVLLSAGLATTTQGNLIAVASRLVLIVVQVIPALLFLAYRRPQHETSSDAG